MANQILFPLFRAEDSTGAPLAGGKVYTYQAGTSTPLVTYTDSTLTTQNTNPVILDAQGYPTSGGIWAGTGSIYKIDVQDSNGVSIDNFPQDNYNPNIGAVGAAGTFQMATAAGSSDAITATYSPALTLSNLTTCGFVATAANTTTTPTFAPNGLTAHTITKRGGQALVAGDIAGALAVSILEYNSANTRWELLNPATNLQGAETTLASASSTDLGTAGTNIVSITGTTTITAFGSNAVTNNPIYFIRFTGILTLTYNATSLILPGSANITTAAGDTAMFQYMGSGNWQCLDYQRASGLPIINPTIPPIYCGFVNKFRNSSFAVWQRAISGTVTTGNVNYTADGWMVGATGATVNWQQIGEVYQIPFSIRLTGNTSMTDTFIKQRIESQLSTGLFDNASGGTPDNVTVQWRVQNTTGGTITPTCTIKHAGTTDSWGSPVTDVNAVSLQAIADSTIAVLSYTFTPVIGTGNGLEVTLDFGAALNSNAKSVYITDADIRVTPGISVGLNSNPPATELRDIATETSLCQRYLASFGTLAGPIGTGAATSTSASGYFIPFLTSMRVAPTGLSLATAGDFEIATFAGVDIAATTGLTFNQASPVGAFITASVTGTPLTNNIPYFLYAKTALAGNLIFTGAEL